MNTLCRFLVSVLISVTPDLTEFHDEVNSSNSGPDSLSRYSLFRAFIVIDDVSTGWIKLPSHDHGTITHTGTARCDYPNCEGMNTLSISEVQ